MDLLFEWFRWLRRSFEQVAPPLSKWLPWVGGLLLILAAGFGVRSWRFAHARVRAVATVTENVPAFAKKGRILYSPRLRFRTPGGEIIKVMGAPGTEDIEFPAGETVPVLYPFGDPRGAIIATAWRTYYGAIVFGLSGTALFDLGWALRVMFARRRLRA